MKILHGGLTASEGITIGKAFQVKKPDLAIPKKQITKESCATELNRYLNAIDSVYDQLISISDDTSVLLAQASLVRDESILGQVKKAIEVDLKNAELAVYESYEYYLTLLKQTKDAYLKDRATDIMEVRDLILSNLLGINQHLLDDLTEPSVLIASDLSPSDTLSISPALIRGLILGGGNTTSHIALIAKSLEIPAIVAAKDLLPEISHGEKIILYADETKIICSPSESQIQVFTNKQKEKLLLKKEEAKLKQLPVVTLSHKPIKLAGNAMSLDEVGKLRTLGCNSIGLFRSEFFYMNQSNFPTEEEQYQLYKDLLLLSDGEVTIRTLDIGGDKVLPYYALPQESNPFLGYRGIRIYLDHEEIAKPQLRALLRASVHGKLRILFPMITEVSELLQAKELLTLCQKELQQEGHTISSYSIGCMIETPAAVLEAMELGMHCDFFSIGTNDLIQYLYAIDRTNPLVNHRYEALPKALRRALSTVLKAGRENHLPVSICGEIAGNCSSIDTLLDLGFENFSVSIMNYNTIKQKIRNHS